MSFVLFFSYGPVCVYCVSVCDEHKEFKDVKLFYRFRKDDGTFPLDNEVKAFMRGQRLYEKYVARGIPHVILTCGEKQGYFGLLSF